MSLISKEHDTRNVSHHDQIQYLTLSFTTHLDVEIQTLFDSRPLCKVALFRLSITNLDWGIQWI